MKPVIDHMRATQTADKVDSPPNDDCDCQYCNLGRAYLDLRAHGWAPLTYSAFGYSVGVAAERERLEAELRADLDIPTFLRRKVASPMERAAHERNEDAAVFINDVRTALMRYEGTFALKGVKA